MTTKHTQGPWKVIKSNHLPDDGTYVADLNNCLVVVQVEYGLGDPLADAQLIAAAPDLLEALVICESNISSLLASNHPKVYGEWLTCVRAALSKATEAA